jgi:hypothetical protein
MTLHAAGARPFSTGLQDTHEDYRGKPKLFIGHVWVELSDLVQIVIIVSHVERLTEVVSAYSKGYNIRQRRTNYEVAPIRSHDLSVMTLSISAQNLLAHGYRNPTTLLTVKPE